MSLKAKKRLRVIVLVHEDLVPPDTLEGQSEKDIQLWKTEYDVVSTLRKIGHEVFPLGLRSDLAVIERAIEDHKPHVAFNLLEEFHGYPLYDQHVVSYLELKRMPYTGCNPRGLTIAHDKALTKEILTFHRVHVPGFAVFPINRKVRMPRRLKFPLFVKSLIDEGSAGISKASVVRDEEKLAERVDFIHRQNNAPAIAEEFIEGREIYVGVIGNQKLQTYTPWELVMKNLPEGESVIATGKVKWDINYQKQVGVATQAASLAPELGKRFEHTSKRIYRLLGLSGYARLDYRLTEDGLLYLIEANPNAQIARNEDFADSAEHCGIKYEQLLQKIITLGLSYRPFI
ncbi:MAG TPA: D-alanine--D-alanine ligase [Blastocatellia bacterium]|nr:D-alanine--D-alanine ligase [Blastocatellia bacterium]